MMRKRMFLTVLVLLLGFGLAGNAFAGINRDRAERFCDFGKGGFKILNSHFSFPSIASQIIPGVLVPLKRSIS